MTNMKRIAAITAAAAVAVGTVGLVLVVAPANADQTQSQTVATNTAPAAAEVENVAARSARGSTVVTFNANAIAVLSPLKPKGLKPGVFGLSAYGLSVQAVFPIVGDAQSGVIKHVGGLSFTDGQSTLVLRNYVINTTSGVLTARGRVNNVNLGRVPFLNVALTSAAQGCDASADLTVAAPAAQALTKIFGAPDLTGAAIGTACINFR